MTLAELLAALTQTNLLLEVVDSDNTSVIKFYAGGTAALSSTLTAREVDTINIAGMNVKVVLKAE